MATTTYIRKSGSEIELADTKEHRKFAKAQGWKKKKVEKPANPQIEIGADNG